MPFDRTYPLTGTLVCGSCGSHMTGEAIRARSAAWFYYKCPNTRFKSKTSCREPRVRALEAEQEVMTAISRVQLPHAVFASLAVGHAGATVEAHAEIEEIRSRLSRLRQLFVWGDVHEDQYLAARKALDRRVRALEEHQAIWPLGDSTCVAGESPQNLRKVIRSLIEYVRPVVGAVVSEQIHWRAEVKPYLPFDLLAASHVETPHVRGLTRREQQILRAYYAAGTYRSTAERLGVSVHTVRNSLAASRRKLGVSQSHRAAIAIVSPRDKHARPLTSSIPAGGAGSTHTHRRSR